jgi:hypothetical protein
MLGRVRSDMIEEMARSFLFVSSFARRSANDLECALPLP